jgi:hypothetical protein
VHPLPKVAGLELYSIAPENAAAMSADGKLIAVPTSDRLVWWDLDKGTIAGSVAAPTNAGNGLWISPDNRTLLVKTHDDISIGLIAVDMATGQTRTVLAPEKNQYLLVSGDRTAVAVCRRQGDGQPVLQLERVSDGAAEGHPYSAESLSCGNLEAADATGLTDISSTPWDAGFLDGNGRYVIAANNSIRIYQIGQQAPVDSYEFGHPNGSKQGSPFSFIDVSRDARTVIYTDENGIGGPLALDPAAWKRDLCRIIGYREFTPDEQTSLPARIPTQQVCPAAG